MREIENPNTRTVNKRRLKHPGRFIIFMLAFIICLWMIYNFIIALSTGQKFSIFGNSPEAVKNVVVAGVDEGGYRTDLIMLCQVDRYKGEINILQIPRDTRVQNQRNDKKINSAYFSGFDVMSAEIEQVTGISADDYIMLDFKAFEDVIDAMGGVEVDVPIRMDYTDPVQDLVIDLQPGLQKLNGEQAQMFMRFRQNSDGTGYAGGDAERIQAQKILYSAVFDKLLSPVGVLRAPAIFIAVKNNSQTNMSGPDVLSFMRDFAAVGMSNIKIHTLPGSGGYRGNVSYYLYDEAETQNLISENFTR